MADSLPSSTGQPKVSWWQSLTAGQRRMLIILIFILALALPLSYWGMQQGVNWFPQAFDITTSAGSNTNQPPTLTAAQLGNTLTCRVNQTCEANFKASDPDVGDTLKLAIDFLPPALRQNTCDSVQVPKGTYLSCSFSGLPERAGQFKLLLTASDRAGNQVQKVFNLNVKE